MQKGTKKQGLIKQTCLRNQYPRYFNLPIPYWYKVLEYRSMAGIKKIVRTTTEVKYIQSLGSATNTLMATKDVTISATEKA